jgi:hypothetical protein
VGTTYTFPPCHSTTAQSHLHALHPPLPRTCIYIRILNETYRVPLAASTYLQSFVDTSFRSLPGPPYFEHWLRCIQYYPLPITYLEADMNIDLSRWKSFRDKRESKSKV